jgi:hypothetical protein
MAEAIAEHWLTSTEKPTDLIVGKKKNSVQLQTGEEFPHRKIRRNFDQLEQTAVIEHFKLSMSRL